MKIRPHWFNIYLISILAMLMAGCSSTNEKKDGKKNENKKATVLRIHVEMNPDGTGHVYPVPVYRQSPVQVPIFRTPILNEGDVEYAQVVDVRGGFAIRLVFDSHGSLVLETTSNSNRGRRLAIYSQFGEARWLAAPLMRGRITNGELVFTPDATREEAERIVLGLNNISDALRNKPKKKKTAS